MSQAVQEVGVLPRVHYLNASYGWKSWLFTTDHKRIAWLYLAAITFFFFVGGAAATLMRLNLIEPQGSLIEPSTYNRMFTLHGLGDDLLFSGAFDTGGVWGTFFFFCDWRQRRRLSENEYSQLVHL